MYQLSDNSIFAMMYKTTMEPQKGMYAIYFKKNGLQPTKEIMSSAVASLAERDWETASRLLLSSMESIISGPTSIIASMPPKD